MVDFGRTMSGGAAGDAAGQSFLVAPGLQAQSAVPPPNVILGTTGLRHASGFLDEEFLSRLKGIQGVRFYRQMVDSNSILGAILFIIDSLVRQVPWRVTPADDKPEARRWAEYLEENLDDMSHTFEDMVSEILSFLTYGWSYFEVVYKLRKGETNDPTTRSQYSDGLIGLRKVEIRSQDTLWQWAFDPSDMGLRGMIQLDPYNALGKGPVFLPIEKALLFRTRTYKNNPEGRALLRSAVSDYHYVTRIREIEAIGIERDLTGMPMMEVPKEILLDSAGSNEKKLRALLETMIQQIRVDERWGGLVPASINPDGTSSGFKFNLVTTGGKRMIDTNEIIKRYESRIAMTFLSEFIMIGTEKVGTQSLFQGKSNLFGIALGTLLDMMSSVLNRYCFAKLFKMNNVPRDLWPELDHGDVVSPDLDKLGKFVSELATAGVLSPNRKLEAKLLEMGNLPTPEDEDMAIFDDPTKPTPANASDFASGLLSERQVEAVLKINQAISEKKMSRKAAEKLLGATLGMDPEEAAAFIEEDPASEQGPDPMLPAVGGNITIAAPVSTKPMPKLAAAASGAKQSEGAPQAKQSEQAQQDEPDGAG